MKKFKLLLIAIQVFLIMGCASSVKPISKNLLENKTFILVPTGQVNYFVISSKGGGPLFGIIGNIIEQSLTSSSTDKARKKLSTEVPPEFLLKIATNELEIELKKYGNYKVEIINAHTLKDSPYLEWSKDLKRQDLKGFTNLKGDVIVDVGVANLTVYRGFAVSRATLGISLRFIDKNNGLLYGEINETVNSHPDGGGFDIDDDSPESTAELKKIFECLVRQSVDNGLSKILAK